METKSDKKILSGVIWSYAERFSGQIVAAIISIILARILSPEHYGTISIVTVFITICDAFVIGGFGNALIQNKNADDLDFDTICWLGIGMSVVLYIVLFFTAPLIEQFYEMDMLTEIIRVMGLRVIISAYNSVQQADIQKRLEFKKFFFSSMIGIVISATAGIIMAYSGMGVWALVVQYMANSVINTVVLAFMTKWHLKFRFSKKKFQQNKSFGFKLMGATLVSTFQDNIRSLVVGKVFSAEDLAFYNQGKKYPQLLMSDIVGSIGKVLFPALSNETDDKVRFKSLMRNSVRISSYVMLPAVMGLMAVSDNFVLVFFTEKWMPCVPYMRILAAVYLTRPMGTVFQNALLAIGRSDSRLVHESVCASVSLVFIFLGAFVFKSVELIAVSYIIAMLVGAVIATTYIVKNTDYKLHEICRDYFPYFGMSLLMALAVILVGFIPVNPAIVLVIQIITGVIVYVLMSIIFKVEEMKIILKLVKKIFKSKKR